LTAVLAVGLATGLAACGEDPPPPEPTPTVVAKKPTPSPSLTADELDSKAAEAVVLAYEALIDELEHSPDPTRINEGDLLARDAASEYLQADISDFVEDEVRVVGEHKVEIVGSVKNGDGTWAVDACHDVTDADALDKDGKSVVPTDRQNRSLSHYTVSKDTKDLKFYVINWTDKGMEPC
jgi:hypothetical protein